MATRPELLEHIFAHDADDEVSCAEPAIAAFEALPPLGHVTAVRNWNWAASQATGELLMVIADDLVPTRPGWDDEIRAVCGVLDPRSVPFAMKVCDSDSPREHLMRHPIVSRRYYEMRGLWDPGYHGICVDNDFTFTAHAAGIVLDGRHVRFDHIHPSRGSVPTVSHGRISSTAEIRFGRNRYDGRWPDWRRRLINRYLTPRAHQRRVSALRRVTRAFVARAGWLAVLLPTPGRRLARRLVERS
jgi:hypothetical protein